ncbi:MAG: insulinase family protein [Myxococcales bacterium]|nr:insulinase family protein [Myxococcales bacterium]
MIRRTALPCAALLVLAACGGHDEEPHRPPPTTGDETTVEVVAIPERQPPPESGPPRDIEFPDVVASTTTSGLAVNTVRFGELPVVYLRMVIRSGGSSDPAELPGLAHFVGQMLKEGTQTRTSAQLAEQIEFLGANLDVGDDEENVFIVVRALADQLDPAMELLADIARNPRFSESELRRLKTRELDRLRLLSQQPQYLARRTLYAELYGSHPYAHVDATPASVERVRRPDLTRWHRAHVVPNNAILIAVGNVDPAAVQRSAEHHFGGWSTRTVREPHYPALQARTAREVVIVDRPSSQQSTIFVGNLALARNAPDFVPLEVANQVLGGSAASRLFMDLREQRSLTYGAYSQVGERAQVAPFVAFARVRNQVTAEAVAGFFEHLDRIVAEAPPDDELNAAQRYLSDSFPLQIETASRIGYMVQQLRVFDLPADYWDTYRSSIRSVTPAQAHAAAQAYIHPDTALVVAVGRAADIVEPLRRYGPVRVIDTEGRELSRFEAAAADAPAEPGTSEATEATEATGTTEASEE